MHDQNTRNLPITTPFPDESKLFEWLAAKVTQALLDELDTYPKPGMVSRVDNGSHTDMTAETFEKSISVLEPFFIKIAESGFHNAPLSELRKTGISAEKAMLETTKGVNTHRGAIFSLGLLCAAAAATFRSSTCRPLPPGTTGRAVTEKWAQELTDKREYTGESHGIDACKKYKTGGAREEAALGFPNIYLSGLPALRHALREFPPETARVHCFFALLESVPDTTILHRGGMAGLEFAGNQARTFMAAGGVTAPDWQQKAIAIHKEFVRKNLSAGGVADLLAATLFIHELEESPQGSPRPLPVYPAGAKG